MRQQLFEQLGRDRWQRLAEVVDALEGGAPVDTSDFPHLYRRVCQDLALARDRQFGGNLVESLNQLALRGHNHLYRASGGRSLGLRDFALHRFPRAVRAEWRLWLLTSLIFYGTAAAVGLLGFQHPDLIYSFMDPELVQDMEDAYRPDLDRVGERGSDDDVLMFGYYIWNNIGIAFRTFASGLVLGLGTLFTLIVNALFMGLIAGHLTRLGFGSTFWPFVVGHGAFELTAIVLSAVAGMRLGLALLAPGPRRRLRALREASLASLPIVAGAAGMLLVAAGIEAFWSPRTLFAPPVKYAVGACLWTLVLSYLFLAGRTDAD